MNSPSPAVNLGIIGMGYTGRQHWQACSTLASMRVTAAAETSPSGAWAMQFEGSIYSDWHQLIEDASVDAVSVCLPHYLHAEVGTAALQAGKHVLMEKPLAANLEQARQIVEAARRAERVLMVEMTHRFYPPVQAGRELIRAGRLGHIYAVEDRIIDPVVPVRMAPWMFERRFAGGGVALTDGIHMVDRVAWVCGQPLRYHYGVAGWSHRLGDIEDTAAMQLSLADGTPVHLLTAFPRNKGTLDDELTIYGAQGTLRIWAWRGWRFEPEDGEAQEYSCYQPEDDHFAKARLGMAGALSEFAAAILEGRLADPSPQDALDAQGIIEAFYNQVLP